MRNAPSRAVAESRGAILSANLQQTGRIPMAPGHRQENTGNSFEDVLGGQHRRHFARIGPDSVSPDIRMKKKG
jgi:hypothetical protein